jgi:hypothetical protein
VQLTRFTRGVPPSLAFSAFIDLALVFEKRKKNIAVTRQESGVPRHHQSSVFDRRTGRWHCTRGTAGPLFTSSSNI